jgi:hypothetical protein
MKAPYIFIAIIFLLFLQLTSCGPSKEEMEAREKCRASEIEIEAEIRSVLKNSFDSPFPKRNINLSNIIGDTFQVQGSCYPVTYEIISSRKSNSIIELETGDTIFEGKVSRYRGLYYFTETLNDTTYRIFTWKITNDSVYGLKNYLQYPQIDKEIEKGNYSKLVTNIDKKKNIIRLHPNKKELRKLFGYIIKNTEPLAIIKSNHLDNIGEKDESNDNSRENDEYAYYYKVYPIPTSNIVHVELQQKSILTYLLTDLSGKTILQGQFNELENKVDLSNINSGVYALTVYSTTDEQKETIKIVKI